MLLFIVMVSVIAVGLVAIALGQPPVIEIVAWNDDAERRMLREAKAHASWW